MLIKLIKRTIFQKKIIKGVFSKSTPLLNLQINDISHQFTEFNDSLAPKIKLMKSEESNIYEQYLFLDKIYNNTFDSTVKNKSYDIKERLLKIISNVEYRHLNKEFIEFLFNVTSKDKFFRLFLLELYPKNLVIDIKDDDYLRNLMKLLQILSKNSLKNEALMMKILELLENSLKIEEIRDRYFNKQISHLIMIFFKDDYLSYKTHRYTQTMIDLVEKNLSEFDVESLSILIYSISLSKSQEFLKNNNFLENIFKNFIEKDFRSIRIGNLIRTFYNVFSLETLKDNIIYASLIRKMISHINHNFVYIKTFYDLSIIGCILHNMDTFPLKNDFLNENQLLAKNFYDKFYEKTFENKEFARKDINFNKMKNQICTHLLLGLSTASKILKNQYNEPKIDHLYLFMEDVVSINTKFKKDLKYFKFTVFYFAKSNKGTVEFWNKIEKDFEFYLPIMNLEDISYLTSSFKTNLQFKDDFWVKLEVKFTQLLQNAMTIEANFKKNEKNLKNILYIFSYQQKGSRKFWRYFEKLIRNNELPFNSENLLKIVNYMKNILYIEDDFFLSFLRKSELLTPKNIIPYAMNMVSLLDYGKFTELKQNIEFIEIKQNISKNLQIAYFENNDIKSFYKINELETFCEICWIINKLNLVEFYSINDFIKEFCLFHNFDKMKLLHNDILIKFIWVIFSLRLHTDENLMKILVDLLLEKSAELSPSMLSSISWSFGSNLCGDQKFWNIWLLQIKAKFAQFNIFQIILCFCGVAKHYKLINFAGIIYDIFSSYMEEYNHYNKQQCEDILPCLKRLMKEEPLFVALYLKLNKIYENIMKEIE